MWHIYFYKCTEKQRQNDLKILNMATTIGQKSRGVHHASRASWLLPKCALRHSYVWHDSFICVTWLISICMCDMTHSYVWHDSFLYICVTWLIHMCGMTHSWMYVCHDSFICVTWPLRCIIIIMSVRRACTCDTIHLYVWHNSFTCVTWFIHMWAHVHSYVRTYVFICVT